RPVCEARPWTQFPCLKWLSAPTCKAPIVYPHASRPKFSLGAARTLRSVRDGKGLWHKQAREVRSVCHPTVQKHKASDRRNATSRKALCRVQDRSRSFLKALKAKAIPPVRHNQSAGRDYRFAANC